MSLIWQEQGEYKYVDAYDLLVSFMKWARMMLFIAGLVWILGK